MNAVAPILKIRATLRERAKVPACSAPNVVPMTDSLMLGWAESEVTIRRDAQRIVGAIGGELADVKRLVTAVLKHEREVSPLEKLLIFTKLESAAGLARQAFNAMALCSLAAVLWVSLPAADDHSTAMQRAPRAARVMRCLRRGEGFGRTEGLVNG